MRGRRWVDQIRDRKFHKLPSRRARSGVASSMDIVNCALRVVSRSTSATLKELAFISVQSRR